MNYLQEDLNVSLFDNKSCKPIQVNPEDLVDMDLSSNSHLSYEKISIKSYLNGVIRDCLLSEVKKSGSTDSVVVLNLGSGVVMSHPNRSFLMSDGTYKCAKDIKRLDKLMGVATPVIVEHVDEELLIDEVESFDLLTKPECDNFLLDTGVFAGKLILGVSDGSKTLSL